MVLTDEQKAICQTLAAKWGVSSVIHPADFIFQFISTFASTPEKAIGYYFDDGANSAQKLSSILAETCELGNRRCSVLEFASGYGRVTRHILSAIPQYDLTACDIHDDAIRFLKEHLGAKAHLSTHAPEDFWVPQKYDVVFALSFFSHMPKSTFSRWLKALASCLKPDGHLIFTTHGLVSHRQRFPTLLFDREGFLFSSGSEQEDLDGQEYGTTVTLPQYVFGQIRTISNLAPVFFQQGHWWNHQDLFVLKAGSNPQLPSMVVEAKRNIRVFAKKILRRLHLRA